MIRKKWKVIKTRSHEVKKRRQDEDWKRKCIYPSYEKSQNAQVDPIKTKGKRALISHDERSAEFFKTH